MSNIEYDFLKKTNQDSYAVKVSKFETYSLKEFNLKKVAFFVLSSVASVVSQLVRSSSPPFQFLFVNQKVLVALIAKIWRSRIKMICFEKVKIKPSGVVSLAQESS